MNLDSMNISARRQLEKSWQGGHRYDWLQTIKALGSKIVATLTQDEAPRITSVMTAEGMQWRVYDPVGDRTYHFTQESEVRAWLEQRYYLK